MTTGGGVVHLVQEFEPLQPVVGGRLAGGDVLEDHVAHQLCVN
ncbi:hypothetical protein R6V09_01385 [Streptomyces sp. W16]|nr:hypothetical protein [Streptomyces sp. W16]MDV9168797.1 hypothetical protein [Streptomyces sp. W16]